MFNSIAEYAPLIQLIVGSIFLNAYYNYNKWYLLTPNQKKEIILYTPSSSGLNEMFVDKKSSEESMTSQKKLYKSVLVIFTLFGSICLFYCANCHNINGITKYNVSCLGQLISTTITTCYLLWAVAVYTHNWRPWYTYMTYITFALLAITFGVFFCFFPNLLSNALEPYRSFTSVSLLIALLLWFTLYAKKWAVVHIFIPYWMDAIKYLQFMLPKTPVVSPSTIIEEIIRTINTCKMKWTTKKILIVICGKYLKSPELYCYDKEKNISVSGSDIKTTIENKKNLIKSSQLHRVEKMWLISKIPKKKISINITEENFLTNNREQFSTKTGMRIVRKLAQFGAFEKNDEIPDKERPTTTQQSIAS